MKISLNWLERHIDLYNKDVKSLETFLLKLGYELDSVKYINQIESCQITQLEKINDKLTYCNVYGHKSKLNYKIVCGAKNLYVGMNTLMAHSGTNINGNTIQNKTILGFQSNGMLLSHNEANVKSRNIPIKNPDCHDGIVDIDSEHPIHLYDDVVLNCEIATNRWDLKNIRGLARQLAIFKAGVLKKLTLGSGSRDFSKNVVNYTSTKASFVEIDNIKIPEYIKTLCDNTDIICNNDLHYLNNFIITDIGHPIHIYDEKYFNNVTMEKANYETVETLDHNTFNCTDQEILIKDNENIICIGGIIGVKGYEEESKNVVIEACYFHNSNITQVITSSAQMFEYSIDNQLTTLEYICSLVHGEKSKIHYCGSLDNCDLTTIFLSHSYFTSFTGLFYTMDQIMEILENAQFKCKIHRKKYENTLTDQFGIEVTIPSFRTDIKHPRDLIEEIMLHIGYDVFGYEPINKQYREFYHVENNVRDILAQCGCHEVYNLPFVSEPTSLKIKNSIYAEKTYFRQDPLLSLMENCQNMLARNYDNIRIFEIEHNQLHLIIGGKSHSNWYNQEKNDIFYLKKIINKLSYILEITEQYTLEDSLFFQGIQLNCGKMGILRFDPKFPKIKDFSYLKIKIIPKNTIDRFMVQDLKEYFNISISSNLTWDKLEKYIDVNYKVFDVYEHESQYKYGITVFSKKDHEKLLKVFKDSGVQVN